MTIHRAYSEADMHGDWSVRLPFEPESEIVYFVDEENARRLHERYARDDSWGATLYHKVNKEWKPA